MSNPPNHSWIIQSSDGAMDILIPQCCEEWANIAIGYADDYKRHQHEHGCVFRKVVLPGLEVEESPKSFGEMSLDTYKKYLVENRDEIAHLIDRLNSVVGQRHE